VPAASVAEPATCQKTLHGDALFIKTTEVHGRGIPQSSVLKSPSILKMKTALGSPWASSVVDKNKLTPDEQ
jgi:hypothetical protein